MNETIKRYMLVTKPGIVCGNLIAASGGFLLASRGSIDTASFLATVISISLVVASACVFNNCADRNLDRKMVRTRNRVMALRLISLQAALCYGLLLGLAGFSLLWTSANGLCFAVVLSGFMIYVGAYSLYLKCHCLYATMIGSLAGAAPPLAGYCAVSGRFDLGATILVAIFCLWQIPHSHAIAIFRLDDYQAAAIPVLPVKRGTVAAKKHIIGYILAFIAATLMLTLCGYTGYSYLTAMSVLGLSWLFMAWNGYKTHDEKIWAKRMFVFSILSIVVLSVMMAVDSKIPPDPAMMHEYQNLPATGDRAVLEYTSGKQIGAALM